MVRSWYSRACPLRSRGVVIPSWIGSVGGFSSAGEIAGAGGVVATGAKAAAIEGHAAAVPVVAGSLRAESRGGGQEEAPVGASPRAVVPDSSGTVSPSDGHSGDSECVESDGESCSDKEPLSPGTLADDTTETPPALDPESLRDGHTGAADGTLDSSLHLRNEGDGDSDGDVDNGLAAREDFAEHDVNQSSGTVTPMGSISGSEMAAGEHPLDAAFYDEVFISDGERAGDSPFRTKEEFFAFVLISNTVGLTERQYNISRTFHNFDRERRDALPCYTKATRRIIPAAINAGGLPMESLAV